MEEKKSSLTDKVENTMACSAFAEAGEPCPIDAGDETSSAAQTAAKKKSKLESVEDTMACSAFAEAGEPCPIDTGDKKK